MYFKQKKCDIPHCICNQIREHGCDEDIRNLLSNYVDENNYFALKLAIRYKEQ
jgi:hypothetical protein